MKKKYPGKNKKGLNTLLFDEIVDEARRRFGDVSLEDDEKIASRLRVRRHTTAAQRWREIFESFGWAAVAFCIWVSDRWMERTGDRELTSFHKTLEAKRFWLH